jgi:hypothetical protein
MLIVNGMNLCLTSTQSAFLESSPDVARTLLHRRSFLVKSSSTGREEFGWRITDDYWLVRKRGCALKVDRSEEVHPIGEGRLNAPSRE